MIQLDLWGRQEEFHWKEFKIAREYARSLKLSDQAEWEEMAGRGDLQGSHVPANPDQVYRTHGWKGWEDWLGPAEPVKQEEQSLILPFDNEQGGDAGSDGGSSKWMNFFEARQTVREYGFEYKEEWEAFVAGKFRNRDPLPDNIPADPDRIYRFVGWRDWKDWLVDPEKQVLYTGYYKARDFVRSCRLPGREAWREFLEQNADLIDRYSMKLPLRPHLEYCDTGWKSWEDWLGSEISYNDFKSTQKFIHSLKLKNKKEWNEFCSGRLLYKPERSERIFAYPELAYRDEGWKSWEDWLGTVGAGEAGPTPGVYEVIIDCKCKGRIKDCPRCGGKGYYEVRMS